MKKGISLVALVITIIVLIILTAAVILTGGNAPDTAKQAVFMSDVSTIQDAVTLFQLNYMAENEGVKPTLKDAAYKTIDGVQYFSFATTIDDDNDGDTAAVNLDGALLNVPGIDLSKWAISDDGIIIYKTGVQIATDNIMFNTSKSFTSTTVADLGITPTPIASYTK